MRCNEETAVTVIGVDELRIELENFFHLGVGIGKMVDLAVDNPGETGSQKSELLCSMLQNALRTNLSIIRKLVETF